MSKSQETIDFAGFSVFGTSKKFKLFQYPGKKTGVFIFFRNLLTGNRIPYYPAIVYEENVLNFEGQSYSLFPEKLVNSFQVWDTGIFLTKKIVRLWIVLQADVLSFGYHPLIMQKRYMI
jgi:hypothetical protein